MQTELEDLTEFWRFNGDLADDLLEAWGEAAQHAMARFQALTWMIWLVNLFCLQLPADLNTIYPFRIYGDGAECQGQLFFVYMFGVLQTKQFVIYMYADLIRRGELWNHFAHSCCLSIKCHDGLTVSATYLNLVKLWFSWLAASSPHAEAMLLFYPLRWCWHHKGSCSRSHWVELWRFEFGPEILQVAVSFTSMTCLSLLDNFSYPRHWSLPCLWPMGLSIFPGLHAGAVVCCWYISSTSGPSFTWMLCRCASRPRIFEKDIQVEELLGTLIMHLYFVKGSLHDWIFSQNVLFARILCPRRMLPLLWCCEKIAWSWHVVHKFWSWCQAPQHVPNLHLCECAHM